MSATSRDAILDASLSILRSPDGPALSLESAARAAGLSKPGLMYHFPTKVALLNAVVERVTERWESAMERAAGGPANTLDPSARYRAYVEMSLADDLDRADLAVFFDAHLRAPMHEVWSRQMGRWLDLPEHLAPAVRGRLTTARLAADGYWIAAVSDLLRPSDTDRAALRGVLLNLLENPS